MSSVTLAQLAVDESGSLPDDTPFFTLAGVITYHPETLRNVIRRAVTRTGKRLRRARHAVPEFKWSNASRNLRTEVLGRLAQADVGVFTLTVSKSGRRIDDTPENYAILICELLRACWTEYPNIAQHLLLIAASHRRRRSQYSILSSIVAGLCLVFSRSTMLTASVTRSFNWLILWPGACTLITKRAITRSRKLKVKSG